MTARVIKFKAAAGPTPPRPLGEHGLQLWNAVHAETIIDDIAGIEFLYQACAALDLAENAAAEIKQRGLLIESANGALRDNPAAKIELSARALCVRTLQKLGLGLEEVKAIGRPPGS